jgi:hypothetical protein
MADTTEQQLQTQGAATYKRLGAAIVIEHSGIMAMLQWLAEHDGWRAGWWLTIEGGRGFPFGNNHEGADAGRLVAEVCERFIGERPPADHSQIWGGYTCGSCSASGVRLWRDYQTFLDAQSLLCRTCCERVAGKPKPDDSDSIGWHVPAVPTADGSTFWGYSSVPEAACRWWCALPEGA